MSEVIIPTEVPKVVLKPVDAAADEAWMFSARPFIHPLMPSQSGAPDHFNFTKLRQQRKRNNPNWLETGIWDRKDFVGFADLYIDTPESKVAKVGCAIVPEKRGKGYATIALRAITKYGFEERKLARIEAEIAQSNLASQRLVQSAGFKQVKKLYNKYLFAIEAE